MIDADDCEPAPGEIYVVKLTSTRQPCGYILRLLQLSSRVYDFAVEDGNGGWRSDPDVCWMMHFQIIRYRPRPLTVAEVADELRAGTISLCDGPI